MNIESIVRQLAAAERFGRLIPAIATCRSIIRNEAQAKLAHAQRLQEQATKKRNDALVVLAEELVRLHGETGAVDIIANAN